MKYREGVWRNCRIVSVSGTAVRVRVPWRRTPIVATAGDDCSASGFGLVASNGSRAIVLTGNQKLTNAEVMEKLFHSRPVEPPEEEEEILETGFDKMLFIQDVSGSMVREDNEGVYEILMDRGISIGFYSSERFLHWYSLDGSLGNEEVTPGEAFTILDFETREEIPATEWFDAEAQSYIIGASLDESSDYVGEEGPSNIAEADRLFAELFVTVQPLLFHETGYDGQGGEGNLIAIASAAPTIASKLKTLQYQRERSAEEKAQRFLDLYEQFV